MGDSAETLDPKSTYCCSKADTHATDCMLYDNLIQEPEDFNLSDLKKEIGMDYLTSTEVLEDSHEPMLYSLGAEANPLLESLSSFDHIWDNIDDRVSCNRSQSEAYKPVPLVASSSWGWYEDGWDNPSIVGAGLANLGNTCFFNAVLQCFTHSVLLIQGLYSNTYQTPCDCNNERFCLICVLREHIELSLSSTKKTISPWKFVHNLSYFSSSFQRYQQEDAHEFLQCFLDKLECSLNNLKTKSDDILLQTDNLVKQVFGGRVISKLRCCNCNHTSDTYEPSVDLSLEIEDVNSLSTALESFTKIEHIEDEDMMFTCDECKQKVFVEKQLLLDQIPPICTFHLKRFKNVGSYVEKVEKHVEFSLELDLQPYTCGNQTSNVDLIYELYAVVVHEAFTSSCGHYYCYIRSAPDTWYKFDDSEVTRVSEACVLSDEAYILFYAKQGTIWFSNFMETYKHSFNSNLSTTSPKSVLENADTPNINDNSSKDYGFNHRVEDQKNTCVTLTNDLLTIFDFDDIFSPSTPPRSKSPEFDITDYEDLVVSAAKPEQLKLAEKATCKRQRNIEVENCAKPEATRMCNGDLLIADVSSKSENSLMKKSKKTSSFSRNNRSKSLDRFNSVNYERTSFSYP